MGQAIRKEDWNPETEQCYENEIDKRKGNKRDGIKGAASRIDPLAKQINEKINQHKQVAGIIIRMAQDQAALAGKTEVTTTATALKNEILAQLNPERHNKPGKVHLKDDKSFFEYANELCEEVQKKGQIGLYKRYNTASNKFKTWLDRDILFSELSSKLIMDFYNNELIKRLKNKPNTAHTTIRVLKTMYRRARQTSTLSYLRNMPDAFEGTSVKNGKPDEIQKLTIDDIKRIEALDLTGDPTLDLTRDVFLFCFYGAGMRVRDAIQLRWKDIDKNLTGISYTEGKTSKSKYVPIKDKVKAILEKYQGNKSKFVFGMLKEHQDDAMQIYNASSSWETILNRNLKRIGGMAEISIGAENLSTHIARHSFVSIVYEKTKDIRLIQQICNHSSIKTTEDYLKRLSPEEFSHQMGRVLDIITE
jgi:integrase